MTLLQAVSSKAGTLMIYKGDHARKEVEARDTVLMIKFSEAAMEDRKKNGYF